MECSSVDELIDHTIEYDRYGRMKYHPDYHFAHMKRFTEEELSYMCYFFELDEVLTLSFALGKTQMTIAQKKKDLLKDGSYEKYKQLWRSQFDRGVEDLEETPKSSRGIMLKVFGVVGDDGREHKVGFVFSKGRSHSDLLKIKRHDRRTEKARLSAYGQSLFDSCFKNW